MAFRGWQGRNRAADALGAGAGYLPDLFKSTAVALALFDAGGALVRVSPAFAAMLGYGEDEMAGMATADLIFQGDFPGRAEGLRELEAGTARWFRLEGRCRRKDGTTLWCRTLVTAVRDGRGRRRHYIAYVDDITERKRAEEALRESEAKWRSLTEHSPDHIMLLDRDGHILFINHTISGLTREQVMGTCLYDHAPVEFRGNIQRAVDRVFETGEPDGYETEYHAPDGSIHYFEARVGPVEQSGEIAAVTVSGRDVTERQRAEEALRESEAKFRTLAATAPVAVVILQGTSIAYANSAAAALVGCTLDELLARPAADFIHPEYRELVQERGAARLRAEDVPSRYEAKLLTKDGEERWVELNGSLTEFEGKPAILGTAFDITEHKQAEEELRESEERFRRLADASFEGIAIHEGGLIRDANEALGQMFGYKVSELIGMHGVDLAAPESREALLRRIRSPDESRFELAGRRNDGSTFPIELRTRAVTYRGRDARVVAVHDITEHRLVAEARRQAREELEGRVERQLAKGNPYGLTFREFTVLNLAAAGKADKEIAVELAISPLTVHKHMGNILGKMDAASRTEASVRAIREGLLD